MPPQPQVLAGAPTWVQQLADQVVRQRLGHAVVVEVTNAIDRAGRIPMYRCNMDNTASRALSQAVGYTEVAVLAAVTLRQD